jgi:hypothetical protein
METYGRVDVQTHVLLTYALVGGEWSATNLYCFTPGESTASTHGLETGWAPESAWTISGSGNSSVVHRSAGGQSLRDQRYRGSQEMLGTKMK